LLVLKDRYLSSKDFVFTEQVYQSLFRTPGETRFARREILEQSIIEGVELGLLGLGELEKDSPHCRFYKERSSPSLSGKKVIITEHLCKKPEKPGAPPSPPKPPKPFGGLSLQDLWLRATRRKSISDSKYQRVRWGVMNYLQSNFDTLACQINAEGGAISQQEFEDKIEDAFG
jgi:hypothetical protein